MDSSDEDEDDEDKDEDQLDDETRLDLLKSTMGILSKRSGNSTISPRKLDILRLKNANRAVERSRVSIHAQNRIIHVLSIFFSRKSLNQLLFTLMHKLC